MNFPVTSACLRLGMASLFVGYQFGGPKPLRNRPRSQRHKTGRLAKRWRTLDGTFHQTSPQVHVTSAYKCGKFEPWTADKKTNNDDMYQAPMCLAQDKQQFWRPLLGKVQLRLLSLLPRLWTHLFEPRSLHLAEWISISVLSMLNRVIWRIPIEIQHSLLKK